MKIRLPALIRAVGFAGTLALKCWGRTLRYRYHGLGGIPDPRRRTGSARYIFTFWHEDLLVPACYYGRARFCILISRHADGQLVAEVCQRLGFALARGSSTRGGATAVRQLLRTGHRFHIGITPDGPRGPRRQVQPGVIYLASQLGIPIAPSGLGYQRPWRLKTWDRMAVPRPGTDVLTLTGDPLHVPSDLDRDGLEHYRRRVEESMHALTDLAQTWAETGRRPAGLPTAINQAA